MTILLLTTMNSVSKKIKWFMLSRRTMMGGMKGSLMGSPGFFLETTPRPFRLNCSNYSVNILIANHFIFKPFYLFSHYLTLPTVWQLYCDFSFIIFVVLILTAYCNTAKFPKCLIVSILFFKSFMNILVVLTNLVQVSYTFKKSWTVISCKY